MGALNNEYIYRLLQEENSDYLEQNRELAKTTLNAKLMKLLGSRFSSPNAIKSAMMAVPMLSLASKVGIAGNYEIVQKIAGTSKILSPEMVELAALTPYFITTMGTAPQQLNNLRNLQTKFVGANQWHEYGIGSQLAHMYQGLSKFGNFGFAGLAGLAALAGMPGLGATFASLTPSSLILHGLTAIGGIPGALMGALGVQGLGKLFQNIAKPNNHTRIYTPAFTGIGAAALITNSTYNQYRQQLILLQSNNLITPAESLIISVLNDINLNTTTLRLQYSQDEVGRKSIYNANTRTSLHSIFDTGTYDKPDELSKSEELKRRSIFGLNQTIYASSLLLQAALAGPLAKKLMGKNFGEIRNEILDIFINGGVSSKARAIEQTSKRLNIPANFVVSLYTPVTKWFNYPTYEDQMLAITANIHEIQRAIALTLLDIRKGVTGASGINNLGKEKTGIYELFDENLKEYTKDIGETDLITRYLGPIYGGLIKKAGYLGLAGLKSIGILTATLQNNEDLVEKRKDDVKNALLSIIPFGENLKETIKSPFEIIKNSYKRILGIHDISDIKEFMRNKKEELEEINYQAAAYRFLGGHFPDMVQRMLYFMNQQTVFLGNLLDCHGCKKTLIPMSTASWRANFGQFMTNSQYKKEFNKRLFKATEEEFGLEEERKYGKITGFINKLFKVSDKEMNKDYNYLQRIKSRLFNNNEESPEEIIPEELLTTFESSKYSRVKNSKLTNSFSFKLYIKVLKEIKRLLVNHFKYKETIIEKQKRIEEEKEKERKKINHAILGSYDELIEIRKSLKKLNELSKHSKIKNSKLTNSTNFKLYIKVLKEIKRLLVNHFKHKETVDDRQKKIEREKERKKINYAILGSYAELIKIRKSLKKLNYLSPIEKEIKKMNTQLKKININLNENESSNGLLYGALGALAIGIYSIAKKFGIKVLEKIPGKFKKLFGIHSEIEKSSIPKTKITETKISKTSVNKIVDKEITKLSEKELAKYAAKSTFKTMLKKIPLISILAGLGFGTWRYLQKDYTGAKLELTSGLAGTIPGIGTVGSLSLDGYLAYRDLSGLTEEEIRKNKKPNAFNFITPVNQYKRISSYFGKRYHPIDHKWKMHNGIDIAAKKGTPVYAVEDGEILYAGWARGYGNFIKIKHKNGFISVYGHLEKIAPGIKTGVKVQKGQVIGFVGSTGKSTGPHLHFGLMKNGKWVDPMNYGIGYKRNLAINNSTYNSQNHSDLSKIKGNLTYTNILNSQDTKQALIDAKHQDIKNQKEFLATFGATFESLIQEMNKLITYAQAQLNVLHSINTNIQQDKIQTISIIED